MSNPVSVSSQRLRHVIIVVLVVLTVSIAPGVVMAESNLSISTDLTTNKVEPGESVELSITVTNSGSDTSPAPVVTFESLPDGWSVESWSADGATYRDSTNEWLWTQIPSDDSETLTVELEAPDSETDSQLSAIVTDGHDNEATASTDISVRESSSDRSGGGGGGGASIDPATVSGTADLSDGEATVGLSGGTGVNSVSVSIPGASGEITAQELEEMPQGVPAPPQGQTIVSVNISAPDPSSAAATVTITVSSVIVGAFNANPSNLRIVHYSEGEWVGLNTDLVSEDPVVLEAQTENFSPFAVVQADQVSTVTSTETKTAQPTDSTTTADTTTPTIDTNTPTSTDKSTETTGQGSGFGLVIGLVSLVLVALRWRN